MYDELKKIIEEADKDHPIVFFGGAGVSTESGIPDFRSETGLYNAKQEYGRSPEEMLSHSFFEADTKTFFDYYKKNLIATWAKPNKAHYALAELEKQGKLKAVITQNIDGLHQKAGSREVLELHGSVLRNYCMKCGKFHSMERIYECDGIPYCECGGMIKPDVVLYEEGLDQDIITKAVKYISEADVLIIGGTSLVEYPAAGLVDYYRGDKLVLVNKAPTARDQIADLIVQGSIGEIFSQLP